MEDHNAIPILRPSHKRALEFFNDNEFKELTYGLPKKVDQNALTSLRELEDKTVRSRLKFIGDPKQGTLKRSERQKETGNRNFSEIDSLSQLEALGGIVTDINGYAHPIRELRVIQPRKRIRTAFSCVRNHSAKRGSVPVHHFQNVRKSGVQNVAAVGSDEFKTNKQIYKETNNCLSEPSLEWNEILNRYSSNVFFATQTSNDEEPLPDINSFADTFEVLEMFEDRT